MAGGIGIVRFPRAQAALGLAASAMLAGLMLRPEPTAVAADPPPSRPNVLIFVTDDQRAGTLDVMAQTSAWFGGGGVTFRNGFVTTPLCCPSRASIFTGRYTHNHSVRVNADPDVVEGLDQRTTIQRYLHDAGYQTAIVGKYLNSWDQKRPPPHFDRYAITSSSTAYWSYTLNVDGVQTPSTGYSTSQFGQLAVDILDDFEQQDDTAPWFLYVATTAPHEPYVAEQIYADAPVPPWYGNPALLETDRSDKPQFVRNRTATLEEARAIRKAQLRTLMSVDDMVDRIMTRLNEFGEEDTIAFFLSDNGLLWGEHGVLAEKRLPYLQSVRVPFLMRWPGRVPPGSIDERMATNVDLFPTIIEATELQVDPMLPPPDGMSLLSTDARERLLLEYYRSPETPVFPTWAAILTPDWQYVEYYADNGRTVTFREYYDLLADPWQNENRLGDGDAANDPEVAALSHQLANDRACVGSACWSSPPPTFADGFESGALDRWNNGKSFSVWQTKVRSGLWAGRAEGTSSASFVRSILPSPHTDLYLRTWFVVGDPTTGPTVVARLVANGPSRLASVRVRRGGRIALRNEVTGAWVGTGPVVEGNTWHELRLHLSVKGTTSLAELWLDDALVTSDATDLGTAPAAAIQLGDRRAHTFRLTFDDVALAETPVD